MKLFLVLTICLFHFLVFGIDSSGYNLGPNDFPNVDAGLDIDRLKYGVPLTFNPILIGTQDRSGGKSFPADLQHY
jgi:hypothetical protein